MAQELQTIPRGLQSAAEQYPNRGTTFIEEAGEDFWSYPRLLERAKQIGHALQDRGMRKGDHVALVLPTAGEFVPTFLGVIQGGGVPVPLYPPLGMGQLGGYLDHCKHIVASSKARIMVTTGQIKAVLGTVREAAPELTAMLTFGDLQGDASKWKDPNLTLEDKGFIQFTSGSTSAPKGVVLTQGGLAHNSRAIMLEGLEKNDDDHGISWLPLFHDMGLIGFVIAPILFPVPVTFLAPTAFLRRPALWLQTVAKKRGTITYAPNFAFALCTKRIKDEDMEGVDLSSLRATGCGAEPIQADTLRAFAKRFARWGFRESSYVPSYGMAESTLAISFSRGIPTDRVKSSALWGNDAAEPADGAEGDEATVELVGLGRAFQGHEVRVASKETGETLPDRRVGEVQIKGPSVMPGYFENPEKTRETLMADGWMHTGDLGYLVNGQVFLCGRAKDVIILNGRNYYPQDMEWVASHVEGVRTGCTIAFATHKAGLDREAVVLVAESKQTDNHEDLSNRIRAEVQKVLGVTLDDVVIAEVGTVPKTSSGKVQRSKARALYESGELKKREQDGKLGMAKRVLESQLAHLKLSIFGGRKG